MLTQLGVICEERFADQLNQKIKFHLGSRPEKFVDPTLLDKQLFRTLAEHDYFVSKKGTESRTFLYLLQTVEGPSCFFIQKDVYYNQMYFPLPNNPAMFHTDTLIDGEINIHDNQIVFTCFDLVVIGGTNIAQRSLSTRLGILQQDIIKPLHQSAITHPHWPQPFRVEVARHERSYGLSIIIQQYPNLKGLIFTPVRAPYSNRASPLKILQWNAADHHCCSFKLHVIWDKERKAHYQLWIADHKIHKYFDDFSPEQELLKEWKSSQPDGRIIDCRFDKDWETLLWENGYAGSVRKGGWRFVRFRYLLITRDDKTMAEEEKKLKMNWNSFLDPISLQELESAVEEMRTRWKMRERRSSNPSMAEQYLLITRKAAFTDYQPLDRRESTGSISKSAFKDTEETVSAGNAPSNSVQHTSQSIVSGQTAEDDGEMIEEIIEEEVVISGHSVPPMQRQPSSVRSSPIRTEKNSESRKKSPTPLTPQTVLQSIAQKSQLLQKHESDFIPSLPPSITISPSRVKKVKEMESPIDDLVEDRVKQVQRILELKQENTNNITPSEMEPTTQSIEKRHIEEQVKPKKKGKWLDMILN